MSRARDLADRVLHNRTHEDTEGGRESIVTFKGEQSGGEISTLAQIQASHDGTADDQKADLIFKTNDGSDGASPTEAMRINSDSQLLVGETTAIASNVIATFATSDSSTATSAGSGAALAIKNTDTTDNNYSTIYFANSADGIDSAIYGVHEDADGTGTGRSGELVFATANTGGGVSERMRIDSDGIVTKPFQPAFMVQLSTLQTNIAINGTRTVLFDTERFDVGGNFSSNTFTAPVTGKYQLNVEIRMDSVDSGATYYHLYLITSNRTYHTIMDPNFTFDLSYHSISTSVLTDMDANDTAYVAIYQAAGNAQTDINQDSNFSGILIG